MLLDNKRLKVHLKNGFVLAVFKRNLTYTYRTMEKYLFAPDDVK